MARAVLSGTRKTIGMGAATAKPLRQNCCQVVVSRTAPVPEAGVVAAVIQPSDVLSMSMEDATAAGEPAPRRIHTQNRYVRPGDRVKPWLFRDTARASGWDGSSVTVTAKPARPERLAVVLLQLADAYVSSPPSHHPADHFPPSNPLLQSTMAAAWPSVLAATMTAASAARRPRPRQLLLQQEAAIRPPTMCEPAAAPLLSFGRVCVETNRYPARSALIE